MPRALLAALAAPLVAASTALLGVPAAADERVVETVLSVPGTPEADGAPVTLDATLLTTDPAVPRPAVVLAHGLGGTKADSLPTARTLARDGYAVLVYTARGFGASGGLVHLDDPAYEGRDAVAMVDVAADRPEVEHSVGGGGDDPVIGFAGASYGGAVALVAASLDRRIDAVVPAFTYADLTSALVPQNRVSGGPGSLADVTPTGGTGVFKAAWAAALFSGATSLGADGGSSSEQAAPSVCGRFAPPVCRAYLETARTGVPGTDLLALTARSSPDLSRVVAPTLMISGEDDTLFGLDQADRLMRGLPPTTPAATAWVPGGHDGDVSVDAQLDRVTAWFDRYLKHDPAAVAVPALSVTVPETALVGRGDDDGGTARVLTAATYPGRGSAPPATRTLPLDGGEQTVVNPAGARPAALTNLPGGGSAAASAGVAGYPLAVLPGQAATFTSTPVTRPYDLVGSGRVRVRLTSSTTSAVLFASVWDLGPDDPATHRPTSTVLPGRAVAPLRVSGLVPHRPTSVEIALPAVSHPVPVGHRLRLVLATTDSAYAGPVEPATYRVALVEPTLVLPDLTGLAATGGSRLRVPLPLVVGVGVVLVAAAVGLVVLHRSRRTLAVAARPELADVPLVVERLVKTYPDGIRAVDDVSFRAERGQVVGMLGPNGAGKTTTLRMVVGLIRPDAGQVWVEGRPVHAGADVLGSVGALIEGPGFLPHLSGRANLEAYWDATGRPREESHLDEVLAIAGLGSAVERRVRGYSQGMRQRLGVAQAMLGFPSLLLLDEPTNGLDPPQITAMRGVLADYAAGGRTVVISSHLLAEVEQTCDHVVVMARGRVLLSGATAALTSDGRRRLEEAFLDLVGTQTAAVEA